MNFHKTKVVVTTIINVIQLILKVTSFTFWFMQWEALHRIIKYVNYVNLPGNCVKHTGTKGLKFIALEFMRNCENVNP